MNTNDPITNLPHDLAEPDAQERGISEVAYRVGAVPTKLHTLPRAGEDLYDRVDLSSGKLSSYFNRHLAPAAAA